MLLNFEIKILCKSLTEKLIHAFPDLISSDKTLIKQYICKSESGRLISDVNEMCDILDISGYVVTMDIDKVSDSIDHNFLLNVFKKLVLVKISYAGWKY